jgi:hypothetical protein
MFSAWMIGFLLVMAVMVFLAVVIGLPQPFVGLAVLVVLVIGGITAVVVARRRGPPR